MRFPERGRRKDDFDVLKFLEAIERLRAEIGGQFNFRFDGAPVVIGGVIARASHVADAALR